MREGPISARVSARTMMNQEWEHNMYWVVQSDNLLLYRSKYVLPLVPPSMPCGVSCNAFLILAVALTL